MLQELCLLATSYASNHNFWRGDPIDWWMRGVLKCMELSVVPCVGVAFMFWINKRTHSSIRWVFGWAAIFFVWSILLPGMAYRDSDTPTAIGWRWGNRLRP